MQQLVTDQKHQDAAGDSKRRQGNAEQAEDGAAEERKQRHDGECQQHRIARRLAPRSVIHRLHQAEKDGGIADGVHDSEEPHQHSGGKQQ
jgi:hypothetical protein